MTTDSGESDLSTLLRRLAPELLPQDYVFCTMEGGALADIAHLNPIATFSEREGLTLVLTRSAAEGAGYACEQPMRCITLAVHSSLAAVGLTAAVSAALAEQNISANVIAAYYHDHVFVPAPFAEQAMAALQSLSG